MTKIWLRDTLERVVRTFLQGYAAVWVAMGLEFDTLFTMNNLKGGVVAAAISFLMSVGAMKVGNPETASFIKEVPPVPPAG